MRTAALALGLLVAASPAHGQDDVLLLGSSSVNGAAGRLVETEVEGWGYPVRRRGRGASGFARPDFFDWQAELFALRPLDRYALVIVLTGGNDTQALRRREGGWIAWEDEPAWVEEYTSRVREFVDTLCDAGVPRVALLLPANGGRPGWSRRIGRVRAAQEAGARASRCGVVLDPGADELEAVDGVHLSGRGARRMWERIEASLRALLPRR
ncbi:MAG: DUF459 domain-containing protein [Sandaracinaceae bacterium]|nr:DUF459 domain-containing protein [Sandaracinaceae bacterium]